MATKRTRKPATRTIDKVVLHCSDLNYGTRDGIDRFHREKRGWRAIGYGYVVHNGFDSRSAFENDKLDPAELGRIVAGRDLDGDGDTEDETGAHAFGLNRKSVGVCIVGKDRFDRKTVNAAAALCASLVVRHGLEVADVIGHCEIPTELEKPPQDRKTCPNLGMDHFRTLVRAFVHGLEALGAIGQLDDIDAVIAKAAAK